jgi:uncharacterized protein YegP (UPF0339 family)
VIAEWKVKRNKAGRWFWHMVAANGQVIFTSGEDFASQENAKRACENAMARSARAPLKVEDPNAAMLASIRRAAAKQAARPTSASVLSGLIDASRRAAS